MAFKPVLARASCVCDIAGFGEIGEERTGGENVLNHQ